MKKYRYLISVIILLLGQVIIGRGQGVTKFLPVMSPQSPEAASIARYGNYEVNLFTGVPQISIPLYEINVGGLRLPITLDYHASGIRVTDMPSRVGLGWSLNAGGTITRKIMGKPDEQSGNYFSATSTSPWRVMTSIPSNTEEGIAYLTSVNKRYIDVEPDIFSYSFPGHSGKFLFNQKDSFKAIIIPYAPVKIEKSQPGSNQVVFGIRDENGIQYRFDSTEWTNAGSGISTNAISSWMLTDVISANTQDRINLKYSAAVSSDTYFSDYVVVHDNSTDFAGDDLGTASSDIGSSVTQCKMLSQIDFRNGKVLFESSTENREDFQSLYQLPRQLSAVKVYSIDSLSLTSTLVRTILFYQSYFMRGSDSTTRRLRLDSIKIQGYNDPVMETYRFVYNTAVSLPEKYARKTDYWGYFNNVTNVRTDGVETQVPKDRKSVV